MYGLTCIQRLKFALIEKIYRWWSCMQLVLIRLGSMHVAPIKGRHFVEGVYVPAKKLFDYSKQKKGTHQTKPSWQGVGRWTWLEFLFGKAEYVTTTTTSHNVPCLSYTDTFKGSGVDIFNGAGHNIRVVGKSKRGLRQFGLNKTN